MSPEDFAVAVRACASHADVAACLRRAILAYQMDAAAAGYLAPVGTGTEVHFFFQDWPPDWVDLYLRERFVEEDLAVAEARRRLSPFVLSEAYRDRKTTPGEQRIWQAFLNHGWRDGFAVPIHGPGGYFGLVIMVGTRTEWPLGVRHALHLIGHETHMRCRQLAGKPQALPQEVRLTPRELECLRWVAAGLSDARIGEILEVSPTTVKFHVDGARQRLGCKTRPQAVAAAISQGLM